MPSMQKVMLTFGTRPEAIKMAPLIHALRAEPEHFEVDVCVTGQHRQMLDQVLELFEIVPEIDLNLMKHGQDLFDISTSVMLGMRDVLRTRKPDIVLVHGDTTSSLAAAMAGFYTGTKVGHIEAGLRTHDMSAPFPEEFNRQTVGKIAGVHFAPTAQSRDNLLAEKVDPNAIHVTGNTVIDALHDVLRRIDTNVDRRNKVYDLLDQQLAFAWSTERFVLITGHRRENFGQGFIEICLAIKDLANANPSVRFVYPVHLNPNVQEPVNQILGEISNVHLIQPLEYEPFVVLMKHCHLVLTDSGGVQEEAPGLGKPVLVMRDVTERPEAVRAGTVKLVGANRARIRSSVSELLHDGAAYDAIARAHNPYGDGFACSRIVNILRAT